MRSFPPTSILSTRAVKNEISRDETSLPFHSVPHDRAGNEGDDVGEAEAAVYDQHAFRGRR